MLPRRWVCLLALCLVGCDETGVSLVFHAAVVIPDHLDAYCLQLAAGDQMDYAHRFPLTAADAGRASTLSVRPGSEHQEAFDVLLRGERRGWQVSFERRHVSFVEHQVPEEHFTVPSCKGKIKIGSGQFIDAGRLTDLPPAVAAMPVGFAPGQILTVANTTCGDNACQPSETAVSCPQDCSSPSTAPQKKLRQRFAWLRDNSEFRVLRKEDGLPQEPDEPAARIITADVDHDCDLDAIVLYPSGPRVWLQDNGQFAELPNAIGLRESFSNGAAADLDADGEGSVDLVLIGQDRVRVLLNDGKGVFADASSSLPSSLTGGADGVAVGFITADMLPDIVLARGATASKVNALLVAQPSGETIKVTYDLQELTGLSDRSAAVAVAELNGDKFQDVVFGNVGVESVVYLNDPANPGSLGKDPRPLLGTNDNNVVDIIAADLTGKCHTDLVLLRKSGPPRLMFNDGLGTFKENNELDVTKAATQAAVIDLDGDGLLDLVFGGDLPIGAFWMQQRP